MTNKGNLVVITSGGTGLIGHELIKQLLNETPIEHVYALSRKDLPFEHEKLQVIKNPNLEIKHWDDSLMTPEYGFISLGTTKKQAGSNQALEKVDFELVCKVAQQIKIIGVKRLCVVSSLGASVQSPSHYLRCKGKMELALSDMGFEKLVFVRPGPLVGIRDIPRTDERLVQSILGVLKPLMLGPLKRFIPIRAEKVAQAMQYALLEKTRFQIEILDSIDMLSLINKYH